MIGPCRALRTVRLAAVRALAEAQHALAMLGYRIRPYDMHLDARRWCWTRSGRQRSHDVSAAHPDLLDVLIEQRRADWCQLHPLVTPDADGGCESCEVIAMCDDEWCEHDECTEPRR